MPRNSDNSKWYIPLVASTELTARSGDLTQYPADGLIGNLPDPCKTPWPGMVLWLDAKNASSLETYETPTIPPVERVYRWRDRSGLENHGTQSDPTLQPKLTADGVSFED